MAELTIDGSRPTILNMGSALVFIIRFVLISPSSFGHHNDAYMRLHQGTAFFEAYLQQKCNLGRQEALTLINRSQREKVDPDIKRKIDELNSLIDAKTQPPIVLMEKFRLEVHELLTKKRYRHSDRWHEEVVAKCGGVP
jgi:hypothetical protein